jgi:C4-type Zn-finger protein
MALVADNKIDVLNNYYTITTQDEISYCFVCRKRTRIVKWYLDPLPFYETECMSICERCEFKLIDSHDYILYR